MKVSSLLLMPSKLKNKEKLELTLSLFRQQLATFIVILVWMLRSEFHVRLVLCFKVAATRQLVVALLHQLHYLSHVRS